MAVARFSPFEALLLKSQNQRQSAELLLLAWVFVNKHETLEEDRRYLETLGRRGHHERDLATLIAIARRTDLGDIQLAAEVLARDSADTATLFLRQAIALATSDSVLSLRNHHILRFLADLIRVLPEDLSRGFLEVTGRELGAPADPSRRSYWASGQDEDAVTNAAQEDMAASASHEKPRPPPRASWRQRAREIADRQKQEWQQRQRRRDQERQKAQQERRDAEAQAERERQARADQERAREGARQRREEQQRRQDRAHAEAAFHAPYRVRMALIELELEANASAIEIKRAYRRLAQRHHPDRFHGQSEWRLKLASQRFQRIKNAYELLMQHA